MSAPTDAQREALIHYMQGLAALPVWYEWGGSSWPPEPGHYGADCSGSCCLGLVFSRLAEPGFRVRAVDLANRCERIDPDEALPGDFVFYREGSGPVSHVMMVLDPLHVVGAQGGGSSTTTQEIAEAADARVKILLTASYRPGDIVAFGRWRRQ